MFPSNFPFTYIQMFININYSQPTQSVHYIYIQPHPKMVEVHDLRVASTNPSNNAAQPVQHVTSHRPTQTSPPYTGCQYFFFYGFKFLFYKDS